MEDKGHQSTFPKAKFLLRTLLTAVLVSLLFFITLVIGIWDLIEGDILLEGTEGILGGIIIIIGIFLPFLLLKFVFKWTTDQRREFTGFNIGILISFLMIVAFLRVPDIVNFLFWRPFYSGLVLLGGISIMVISIFLLKQPKNHFSITSMLTGNVVTLLGFYNLIGGLLNLL